VPDNRSGQLPLATQGWGFFYLYMSRGIKTIHLYLGISFRDIGSGEFTDDDGECKPIPEGWCYKGKKYKFDDKKDISSDFGIPFNENAIDFDNLSATQNPTYILNQLRKFNEAQLKILCYEIENLQSMSKLTSVPNLRIQKLIQFYETILIDFNEWYLKTNSKIPEECNHSILISFNKPSEAKPSLALQSNNFQNKSENPLSIVDKKKEILHLALEYINDEIRKLDDEYIKRDVIDICANAYEKIVPDVKKKKIIKVTTFGNTIFSKIEHKFIHWEKKQFVKYLSTHISPSISK
jgi:hypothetical protein